MKIAKILAGALSSLMVLVAVAFAAMPCLGPIYEPELPEEFRN